MKKAPLVQNEALLNEKIPFFSDNSEISEKDLFLNFLAITTKERHKESSQLKSRRRAIESAIMTSDHLRHEGMSPIFPAYMFQALEKVVSK